MIIQIDPVGKPRQTQSDRWKQRPAVMRYRAYADELRYKVKKPLGNVIDVTFYLPMPASWSEKRKKEVEMSYACHQQKPDIDNLLKAFLDALLKDDSTVYMVTASKWWARKGSIDIDETSWKENQEVASVQKEVSK